MMLRHQKISLLLILLCAIFHLSNTYKIRVLQSEPEENADAQLKDSDRDDSDETPDDSETVEKPPEVVTLIDTSSSTTPIAEDMMSPTNPQAPEESMYITSVETNKICLAMKVEADIQITSPESHSLSIPDNRESSGHCGPHSSPVISIFWDHSNLTMRINKTKDGNDWAITKLQFEYNPAELFNNDDYEKNVKANAKKDDLEGYTAPLNYSLTCNGRSLTLYDSEDKEIVYLVFSDLRAQAFNVPSEFGQENECQVELPKQKPQSSHPKRKYQSDVAPVAVGSVLAILTLIMLAGYAVYRSMHAKKPDYSTME